MRTVEVFEIHRRVKRCAGPFIEFVQTLVVPAAELHPLTQQPGKWHEEVVHHEHGPVETVAMPDGTLRYVAIQPGVRDLLERPIRQQYDQQLRDLHIDLGHARSQWMAEQKRAHRLLWRQEKFKALSVWRRLSYALRRQLPELSDA